MTSVRPIACTFIVVSANRALFVDHREGLPANGEVVSYDGHDYEVLSYKWQGAPPALPAQDVAQASYAVVRVRPVEGR